MKQEVDAEQGAEDINAVERPMAHNDQTEQDGYRSGEKDEAPRMVGWKLESEEGPDHASGDEAGAEEERQHGGGEQGIDNTDDPGGDIDEAADHPEKKPPPLACMHADAYLGCAGDQKQDSVERHRRNGRDEGKEQRSDPEDDQKHAKGGDRRPFSSQALDGFAETVRGCPDVRRIRHCVSPGSEDKDPA